MDNNTTKTIGGKFVSLLTGWGVPGAIARIIAGGIIGAILAATYTGCAINYGTRTDKEGASETSFSSTLDPLGLPSSAIKQD